VTLVDLPGTVLDLALGPQAPSFPGRTFAGVWAEPSGSSIRAADTLLAGVPKGGSHAEPNEPNFHGSMSSLMAGNLYYIRNGDGVEELYDLASDPAEETDLADNPGYAGTLERLRASAQRRIPRAWLPSVK
jgi:arylsulfatase A-like enzyme